MNIAPLIFLLCVFLLNRPMMLLGTFANAVSILPRWDIAVLAGALMLLNGKKLIRVLRSMSRWEIGALLVLLISGMIHFSRNGFCTAESLGSNLIFLTVPLFGSCAKKELLKIFPPFLSILWFWNSILYLNQKIWVGISGNWNWNASLILVCTPFLLYEIYLHRDQLGGRTMGRILSGAVLVISLYLFLECHSRGAFFALIGTVMIFACAFSDPPRRKCILFAAGALFAVLIPLLVFLCPEKLESLMSSEIRPALWESSFRMLKDHPFGVGAESFEDRFISYKTLEYFMNPHSALRTVHPHNELLNFALLLGIPAMLAWCFLTFKGIYLFLRRFRHTQMEMKLILWGFLVIFLHGMVDLTFAAWPLDILGFLFAGIFWKPLFLRAEPGRTLISFVPRAMGGVLLLCVISSGIVNFAATWNFEQARRASLHRDFHGMRKYARAGISFSSAFPEQVYDCVSDAVHLMRDYPFALELSSHLEKTPYRNIARIHGLKALCFSMLGRDAEAFAEYQADTAAYPWLILPRIGAISAAGRLGAHDRIPAMKTELNRVFRDRGLTLEDVRFIMDHPECDEHQHKIRELQEKIRVGR